MFDALRDAVLSYTQKYAATDGVAATPVPGLFLVRDTSPGELEHAIASPLVCLVLQGRKRVTIGDRDFTFAAGDSMIVTANVPTVSRISEAAITAPYLAIALDLDPAVITDLDVAMSTESSSQELVGMNVDEEFGNALFRLIRLLERPRSLAVLHKPLIREIHYWLLLGGQGRAIRRLGLPDSQVRRIARAVAILRREYTRPLPVERLAAAAGMSRSAFHKHFRTVTSLSPLQFQKQLRLIEARRLMLSKGKTSSRVAFEVGYASVSQFTREYARMYGRPPVRDRNTSVT
ncbi:AraC family transcriptional regulator [Alcanivorax xiamenensis]|uniref:AraC family transcriptional regulator n=1 Tax=Alcanivorax xiamenensis TaxID=1177156 RepID=A0ABQ6Y983_9GAMM|nr:AraC family transcriptional regulator [Alcanivorax xiamenensis]KAF0806072.1 AraC family transcriptional regulator [Alcanivorax xiamenensis]